MTDALSFRTTLSRYLPPWLTARLASGKVRGFKFLYVHALLADLGIENAYQGLQARFPGLGTRSALPYIGRDRVIRRGYNESDESYAARLVTWLDTWRGAGTPFTILKEIQAYLGAPTPIVRIVNQTGTWYTRAADGTPSIVQTWPTPNWVWDNDASQITRYWVLVYVTAGSPFATEGTWGDGATSWGDGGTWGTTATSEQVSSLQAIIKDFSNPGDRCSHIIIAFDPASFDPLAAPGSPGIPDGTWGHASKNVGGVQVPSRLATARYIDGEA